MGFPVKSACLRLLSFPERKPALLNSQLRQHVLISPSSSRSKNIPFLNSTVFSVFGILQLGLTKPALYSAQNTKCQKDESQKARRSATLLLSHQSSDLRSASGNHNT